MARQFFNAPDDKPKRVPAFVVEKLEGTTKKIVHEKTVKGLVATEVEVPNGYMVHLPKGHSIHVMTDEEMHRLGFDKAMVPLIDPNKDSDDSEDLTYVPNTIKTGTKK